MSLNFLFVALFYDVFFFPRAYINSSASSYKLFGDFSKLDLLKFKSIYAHIRLI